MTPDRLLAHYDRIADAPDAIARLRRFVLDLAVRGKLVAQDAGDPPIARRLRGTVSADAGPYVLPATWKWMPIGEQLDLLNGMAFKPSDWVQSGLPIVRIQNLNNTAAPFNCCRPEFARNRSLIDNGAFLISWSGTPGTSFGAFIWDRGPAVLNQHIFRCDFKTDAFEPHYLRLAINGRLDEMIEKAHGGVGLQHITKVKLEALLIALPPLAEQHRIVSKVDELMALCDRLEAGRVAREAARDRLAAASLARLNTPDPDPGSFTTHARFALNTLPALSTRADQIKALRQTILNLAVRGKLVPQAPQEGEASMGLKKIGTRKGQSEHIAPTDASGNALPNIPATWSWTTLGTLIVEGPQNGISPQQTTRTDAPLAITLSATTTGNFNSRHIKRVEANIPLNSGFWLRDGDLLFQRGNTRDYVGMAAIYRGPPNTYLFPDLMMRVRISPAVDLNFVHLVSISPQSRLFFGLNATGAQATMPKINQSILKSLPVPIPPLVEQHRIVAKVDALMALCDRLETAITSGDDTRRRLLDALLQEALASPDSGLGSAA
jgi:type I restriction enzyme S subunit